MCTLVALYKMVDGFPVVVGMNRDEVVKRESAGPQVLDGGVRVYAPQDRQAGGTWLGVNEFGLLAAILNRVSEEPSDAPPQPRSRGLLCLDVLKCRTVAEAQGLVAAETARSRYNKFNLFCLDRERALLICHDSSRRVAVEELGPGLHVLVNWDVAGTATKEESEKLKQRSMLRRRKAMQVLAGSPRRLDEAISKLQDVFRDHEYQVCQHRSPRDLAEIAGHEFATRSSTILAVADAGPAIFLHAGGSPCSSEYKDYSNLFRPGRAVG